MLPFLNLNIYAWPLWLIVIKLSVIWTVSGWRFVKLTYVILSPLDSYVVQKYIGFWPFIIKAILVELKPSHVVMIFVGSFGSIIIIVSSATLH